MDYGTVQFLDVLRNINVTSISKKYNLEIIKVVSDGNDDSDLTEAFTEPVN